MQYYCSEQCGGRAKGLQKMQKRRERAIAEISGYRPSWMPRVGSGYREEVVPCQDGVVEVVREREPKPNYERPVMDAERRAQEAAEHAAYIAEQMAEIEEEKKQRKAAKKFIHDLFDDSLWGELNW